MKVDVLIHPYFTETVRFSIEKRLPTAEEKTRKWYQAISELGQEDWLIVTASAAGDPTRRLTDALLQYARGRLGDRVVVYESFIGDDIARDLGNPTPSEIVRIRGYGEVYGACVTYTAEVRAQLDPQNKVKIEMPVDLSVSLVNMGDYSDIYNNK